VGNVVFAYFSPHTLNIIEGLFLKNPVSFSGEVHFRQTKIVIDEGI